MFYNSKWAGGNHFGPAVQRGPRGAATRAAGQPSKRPMARSPRACPRFCRKVPVQCGYFMAPLLSIAQEAHFSSSTPNKHVVTLSRSPRHSLLASAAPDDAARPRRPPRDRLGAISGPTGNYEPTHNDEERNGAPRCNNECYPRRRVESRDDAAVPVI